MSHLNKENLKRKLSNQAQQDTANDVKLPIKKRFSLGVAAAPVPQQAPIKRNLTLTDLPRVCLVKVLSFIHFYERSNAPRAVCRRLLSVVDFMPSPPDSTLRIRLFEDPLHLPWIIRRDEARCIIKISINQYGKDVDLIQSMPHMNAIRPRRLDVACASSTKTGVSTSMLHHLATTAGGKVSHFRVKGLTCSSRVGLQHAFNAFEQQSKGRLSSLVLEDTRCSLTHVVSATSFLHGLVDFKLELTGHVLYGWQQQTDSIGLPLASLSALPRLRTINLPTQAHAFGTDAVGLVHKAAMASIIIGVSAITHLQSFTCSLMGYCPEGAALLVGRLPALQVLKWINANHVTSMGGHAHLKELGVFFLWGDMSKSSCEALALACNTLFPSLVKLDVQLDAAYDLEGISALAQLKNHPSLTSISFGFKGTRGVDIRAFARHCDKTFGKQISFRLVAEKQNK